jgi:hypothetical protein
MKRFRIISNDGLSERGNKKFWFRNRAKSFSTFDYHLFRKILEVEPIITSKPYRHLNVVKKVKAKAVPLHAMKALGREEV